MRRLFKYILFLGVFIVVLAAGTLLFVTVEPGERLVKIILIQVLERQLDSEVQIDRLETNLVDRLQLSGVRVVDPGSEAAYLLKLDYLRARFRLFAILDGEVKIDSVVADSLLVNLARDSGGTLNIPELGGGNEDEAQKQEPQKPSKFKIDLGYVRVKNSSVSYDDDAVPLDGTAGGLDIRVEIADRARYKFRLTSKQIDLALGSAAYDFRDIRIEGGWAHNTLTIDTLQIYRSESSVAAAGIMSFKAQSEPYLDARLKIDGSLKDFDQAAQRYRPVRYKNLSGSVKLVTSAEGAVSDLQFEGRLELGQASNGRLMIDKGVVDFAAGFDSVAIDSFRFDLVDGKFAGSGAIAFDSLMHHEINLVIDRLDLSQIDRFADIPENCCSGTVSGAFRSSGPIKRPEKITAKGDFTIVESAHSRFDSSNLCIGLSLKETLLKLELSQKKSSIYAEISYHPEKVKGNFSADINDVSELTALAGYPDIEGKISVDGSISGTVKSPAIKATVDVVNSKYQDLEFKTLNGAIKYIDGEFTVENLEFKTGISEINEIRDPVDLSDFAGSLIIEGNVTGGLTTLNGEATISIDDPKYKNFKFDAITVNASIDRSDSVNAVVSVIKDQRGIFIEGSGSLKELTGNLTMAVVADPAPEYLNESDFPENKLSDLERGVIAIVFDLKNRNDLRVRMDGDSLDVQIVKMFFEDDLELGGFLNVDSELWGSLSKPRGSLRLSVYDPRFRNFELDSLKLAIRSEDNQVFFDTLSFYSLENAISVDGRVIVPYAMKDFLPAEIEFDSLRIRIDSLDLNKLSATIPSTMQFGGIFNSNFHGSGSLARPNFQGTIEITGGWLKTEGGESHTLDSLHLVIDVPDINTLNLNVEGLRNKKNFLLEGNLTTADRRQFDSNLRLSYNEAEILSASGKFGSETLDYNIKAQDLNLALFQMPEGFLSTLQGNVNGSVRARGSFDKPDVSGNLTAERLQIKPDFLSEPVKNGKIQVRFDKNNLHLDTLRFQLGDGWLNASGDAQLENRQLTAFGLNLRANNIKASNAGVFEAAVETANIDYIHKNGDYSLTGKVRFSETRFTYRFQPSYILTLLDRTEQPIEQYPEFIRKTQLDIRIQDSDQLWIDNNLAKLRLSAALSVIGTPPEPVVTGRLSVVEGYIIYLDRKFHVEKGVLDFADPNRINPFITLTAVAEVKDYQTEDEKEYTITLNIDGTLEKPKIDLHSQPPLGKQNILALLTLGSTLDQPSGEASGDLSGVIRDRLERYSSKRITGFVSRQAETYFGLKEVQIEGNVFNAFNSGSSRLSATKQIGNRLEMTYFTTIGHINDQGIRLNYKLIDHFSIEGEADQTGKSGVDFKYRIKF